MNLNEQLQKIIEQRTIEATKKEISKKAKVILKAFGNKIMSHEWDANINEWNIVSNVTAMEFDQYGDENDFPIFDGQSRCIGMYYYPLRSGCNLEIVLKYLDNHLSIYYEGNLLYEERDGQLMAYLPAENWEKLIDSIYATASKKVKMQNAAERAEAAQRLNKKKQSVLEYLRQVWGVTGD